jgi:hypothetical protein
MPELIPRSIASPVPVRDVSSKSRLNKKDIDNHRPLSPLGFEQGVINRSIGPALDASPARKAVRRRERRKRSAPPVFEKLLWVRQSCKNPSHISMRTQTDLDRPR